MNPNVNEFLEQAANRIPSDKDFAVVNNVIPIRAHSANTAIAKISYAIGAAGQNNPTIIFPDEPAQQVQGNAMTDPTREEIREELKDKIASAEARTDTKVERLGAKIEVLTATIVGKIDSVSGKIDKSDQYNHETRWWLISIFIVGVFSLAGLIVALTSYGDARFGQGMNVRDVVQTVIKEQQEIQKRDTLQQPRH